MPMDHAEISGQIWECLGCDQLTFVQSSWNSDEVEPEETIYPERTKRLLRPKRYRRLSLFLQGIYEETVSAFNARCWILAAAGLRALLEGICDDKGLGPRRQSLDKKVESLKGYVAGTVVDNLHALRFMGNEALHRLSTPDPKDLALAIEVMEDVMNAIYDLDYKSADLYRRVRREEIAPKEEDTP